MSSYKLKFLNNMLENIIISEMYKVYGGRDIYDKCFMDVSERITLVPFYLDNLRPILVTVVTNEFIQPFIKDTYDNFEQIDTLSFKLDEHAGIFNQQYDVITAIDILDTYVEDQSWHLAVKNLLSYLKPEGTLFVNGVFADSKIEEADRTCRSKGVWKAMVKQYGCSVEAIINNPLASFFEKDKIMVIRK